MGETKSDNRITDPNRSAVEAVSDSGRLSETIELLAQAERAKPVGKHPSGHDCKFCEKIRNQRASAAEKEAKGIKVKRPLRNRQKRFVQAMTNPDGRGFNNPVQAARLAGYSPDSADASAAQLLKDDRVQSALYSAFERLGLSLDYGAEKLKELMECESTALVKDKNTGEVIDRVQLPYWDGRAKGLDQFWRLRGAYPRETEIESGAMVLRVPANQEARVAIALGPVHKGSTDSQPQAVESAAASAKDKG